MTASEEADEANLDQEFVNSTSLHGIARVVENTRTIFRLVWLTILLVCLGVCIAQITDRFRRYFMFSANTAISVEYVGDLNFPAVTICNFNRYRSSAITASDLQFLQYVLDANDYDYDDYSSSSSSSQTSSSSNFPWNDNNVNTTFNYTEFTLRAGFVLDSLTLLNCQWRGRNNSCSAANFTHVFTSFGNCWTFNSGADGMPLLREIQSGSGNGLRMLIDIQQHEYSETLSGNIEAGLKILVHSQDTPPMIDSQGLAIQPGVHAFVAARKQQYLNLEAPYGKCDPTKKLTKFDSYTLEGCNIECRAQKIFEMCNCRLVRHPGNEVECTPTQTNNCAKNVLRQIRSGELPSCNCPVPCNYTTFSTTLSTAAIPNQNVAQLLLNTYDDLSQFGSQSTGLGDSDSISANDPVLLNNDYIRNNWIMVDVFYEDINFQLYQQTEAITLSALISDIGGQMGLFLGASFITIAEILSYLGQKIGKCLTVQKTRKTDVTPKSSIHLWVTERTSTKT